MFQIASLGKFLRQQAATNYAFQRYNTAVHNQALFMKANPGVPVQPIPMPVKHSGKGYNYYTFGKK